MKNLRGLGIVVIMVLAGVAALAAEGLPANVLKRLKGATVLVHVSRGGRILGSGSGFLLLRKDHKGYIVTNQHVVSLGGQGNVVVEVVFNSGEKSEIRLLGKILSTDDDVDLALLEVTGADLPKPLGGEKDPKVWETMPVHILGFPFGSLLAIERHGNPVVTVSSGTLSSLRKDDFGNLSFLQITGDINPGNSGGPIVDQEGDLVGVAVAKIGSTQIGFAIPKLRLNRFFEGRVGGVSLTPQTNTGGVAEVAVRAKLIDPFGKVKNVGIAFLPGKQANDVPRKDDGTFGRMATVSGAYRLLKLDGNEATGEAVLSGRPNQREEFTFQICYEDGQGVVHFMKPTPYELQFEGDSNREADNMAREEDDEDWIGNVKTAGTPTKKGELVITKPGKELLGEVKEVVDAKVRTIDLPVATLIPQLLWLEDAEFLLAADNGGTLYELAVPSFKLTRKVDFHRNLSWIEMSRQGLLVVVNQLQEIWVLDPENMTVKGRIAVAGVDRVASSPTSDVAFGISKQRPNEMSIIDLKKFKVAQVVSTRKYVGEYGNRIRRHPDSGILSDFRLPTVSPDGKYFFCVGSGSLHRFAIKGTELVYEEMGPRIGSNPQRIEISADSRYVALPSGGGNGRPTGHFPCGSYCTYIYKTTDLYKPVAAVSSGAYPLSLGFDKAGSMIYAQNHDHQLITFTPAGVKQKEYVLSTDGDSVRQLLVHPRGRSLLVETERNLFLVQLPAE